MIVYIFTVQIDDFEVVREKLRENYLAIFNLSIVRVEWVKET